MTNSSQDITSPIIFFGTEAWGGPILEQLHDHYPIASAITRPDAKAGRGHKSAEPPIKLLAQQLGIPVLQPEKLTDAKSQIQAFKPSLGVLVAYGRLVPLEIIDLFPHGIINVHPSLLPKYRGPAPIENIILNADQPGFSIIKLNAAMDAGDILYSKPIELDNADQVTSPELYKIAGTEAASNVVDCIQKLLKNDIQPTPQNHSNATFTNMIKKSDGQIDWSKPATTIERQVRAYLGWPGSYTTLLGSEVTVTKARLLLAEDSSNITHKPGTTFKTALGEPAVVTGDQQALVIEALKPAGKREMTGQEFLAGRQNQLI